MTKCGAPNCTNTFKKSSLDYSFYEFPQDAILRSKWISSIGRLNWTPGRRSMICSVHFDPLQFKKGGKPFELIEGAVPTVFPQLKGKRGKRVQRNVKSKLSNKSESGQSKVGDLSRLSECTISSHDTNQYEGVPEEHQSRFREELSSEKFIDDFVHDDSFIIEENKACENSMQVLRTCISSGSHPFEETIDDASCPDHCSAQIDDTSASEQGNFSAHGNVIVVEPTSTRSCSEIYILPGSQLASESVILIQDPSGETDETSKQVLDVSNVTQYPKFLSSSVVSELRVGRASLLKPKYQTRVAPPVKKRKIIEDGDSLVVTETPQEQREFCYEEPDKIGEISSWQNKQSIAEGEEKNKSYDILAKSFLKKGFVDLPVCLENHVLGKFRGKHTHSSVKWQEGTFMCRLCGVASNKTLNIFSIEASEIKLSERISSVLPITIVQNNNLPRNICSKCLNKLDMCSELIVNSYNTQQQLASVMGQDVKHISQMPVYFYGKQNTAQDNPDWKRHILFMEIYHEEDKPLKEYLTIACEDLHQRLKSEASKTGETQCNLVLASITDNCSISQMEQVKAAAEALVSNKVIQEERNEIVEQLDDVFNTAADQDFDGASSVTSDILTAEHLPLVELAGSHDHSPSEVQAMPVTDNAGPAEFDSSNVRHLKYERAWKRRGMSLKNMQNMFYWCKSRDGEIKLACNVCKEVFERNSEMHRHLARHEFQSTQKENQENYCCMCHAVFYSQQEKDDHDCDEKSSKNVLEPHTINTNEWRIVCRKQFFQCSLCNLRFKSKSALKEHLQQEHTASAKCEGCGHEAPDICEATVHRQTCVYLKREEEWRCRKCLEMFLTEDELHRHQSISGHDNEIPTWLCDVCGKRYPQAAKLNQHKKSHLPPEFKYIHQCPHCPKRYINSSRLKEHMQKHDEKKYMCKVCGKLFSTKQILRQHEFTHGDPQFLCSLCSRTFFRKSHLLKHMNVHNPENARASRSGPQPHRDGLNRCRECKEVYDLKDLLIHYKTSHPDIPLHNYLCEICKEENTSYAELFQHQREVHKTGVKDCPFCDKTIDSSTQMKYHLMRHEGMFPYNCPLCSNGYTANSVLQDHIRRKHTGEKPFECQQCSKRFPTSGALAQHSTVHSLPHQLLPCPVCNQGFKRKAHLDVHIRTHTGEKPYPCPICDRPFRQRPDCVKHVRVIHGEDPSKFSIRFHPNMCISFPQVVSVADMELVLEGEDLMQTSLEVNEVFVNQ